MVTPISNDKILPSENTGSAVTDKKKADHSVATQNSASENTVSQDNGGVETSSVDVERANQIYNRSSPKQPSGENAITNPEQAKVVAAEIRTQIEGNALEALKAQAGPGSGGLPALLEAAPI